MDTNNLIGINNLLDFVKFLKGELFESSIADSSIFYDSKLDIIFINEEKIPLYRKVPELTKSRFIEDIKLLETMNGRYIPIVDMKDSKVLFTRQEYNLYRQKMSGIYQYGTGDFMFSDNLYFEELDEYLELIDDNQIEVKKQLAPIIEEVRRVLAPTGLNITIGCNSGGDIELIEAGSTSRGTNIPRQISGDSKWDFDFTVRIDPDKVWIIKELLETGFKAGGHITRTSTYKVRLCDVVIPGLVEPVDLDFSLTPQKENYLSTESVVSERLQNMRDQDEEKYRLVLANIMYAKRMLKEAGAYKPARGILSGNREFGGLGAIGIENWILQHGGSLIDATDDFLLHSRGKEFKEFEQVYAIMDFGQDHVSTSKHEFPYHNFVMKNMRYRGYEIMCERLARFKEEIHTKRKKSKIV